MQTDGQRKLMTLHKRVVKGWPAVLLYGLLVAARVSAVGTWTNTFNAPSGVGVEMIYLLSDGSVMAQDGGYNTNQEANWYQLRPDTNGSYVNGSWRQLKSMHYLRNSFGSQVLRDGRLLLVGDENRGHGKTAEVYDPVADDWTLLPAAGVGFADADTALLPDGRVLVSPVGWLPYPQFISTIYDPVANSWSFPGSALAYQDEASWVKLADNSILTIDINAQTSERFIPSLGPLGQWVVDENVPVPMYSSGETGAGLLLPDGRAFYLGALGHTVLYTASRLGGTNAGTWAQGPDIPAGRVTADAPAVMMPNGRILCAVGPSAANGGSPGPSWFYEFDYTDQTANSNGTFHAVASPGNSTVGSSYSAKTGATLFLNLPDGTVLYSTYGNQLYIYQPDPGPLAAHKPTITSITANIEEISYHLVGTKLNGVSAGSAFGDERQNGTSYPIVRLSNAGGTYYARTYNWSSTGVKTGSTPVSTEFTVPGKVPPGTYSLVVVVNGNPSDPVSFTYNGPVWVDFNYSGAIENGSFAQPFDTLAKGVSKVSSGGTIAIKPGSSLETMTISKPMTITAVGGAATVGH